MKLDLKAPHQIYRNKAGEKVPGVTTVCGVLAKHHLMPWYARMEYEGILGKMRNHSPGSCGFSPDGKPLWTAEGLDSVLPRNKEGKRTWFAVQKRDSAADLGTVAHARIQGALIGDPLEQDGLGDLWEKAAPAVDRFFEWFAGRTFTFIEAERKMVSELWQVGGTADVIARGPDGLELWDVKTGNPWYSGLPYDEQYAQVAAYASMYEETTGRRVERIFIARVGKTEGDQGDLHEVAWKERNNGRLLFEAALAAFKAKRMLSGWQE